MATSYTVVAISEESVATWIEGLGLGLPDNWRQSRLPTPAEIRLVLNRTLNFRVDYFITDKAWQATISDAAATETGRWASLVVLDYSGNEGAPHDFYFDGGWRSVMEEFLSELAKVCGPFVLINNSDPSDVVVASASELTT